MRPLHSRRPRARLADAQQFARDGFGPGMRIEDYLADVDRVRIIDEVEEQLREVALRHFPRTNNLEYAVLKTHVIIECALTHFIRCTSAVLVEPESLRRFSFSVKLEIAVLHGFGQGCPTSVPSVELLNRVRNQMAHQFSFDMQLVNEFIRINGGDSGRLDLTDRQRIAWLRRWCAMVCGSMIGELRAAIHLTNRGTGAGCPGPPAPPGA